MVASLGRQFEEVRSNVVGFRFADVKQLLAAVGTADRTNHATTVDATMASEFLVGCVVENSQLSFSGHSIPPAAPIGKKVRQEELNGLG